MATSHDGQIKIWDVRYPAIPQKYITAHSCKIFTLDFSPVKENQLVSSAADNTIKMWDAASGDKRPVNVLKVQGNAPVWKVRYTPFGEGLVTLVYTPTMAMKRDQNNLLLWSASPHSSSKTPVHKFYGHIEAVQEFAWRNINPLVGRNEFQLVTWGRDSVMTLWPIGQHLKEMCGEEPDEKILADNFEVAQTLKKASVQSDHKSSLIETARKNGNPEKTPVEESTTQRAIPIDKRKNFFSDALVHLIKKDYGYFLGHEDAVVSTYNPEFDASSASTTSLTGSSVRESPATLLKRELSNIDYGEKVVIYKIDLHNRICVFQTETHLHVIYLEVNFPINYPHEAPQFAFLAKTTLNQERGYAIIKRLRNIASGLTNKGLTCLDQVLRVYEEELKDIILREEKEAMSMKAKYYRDSNVPYPRISGARFCGSGQLVCFGWTFSLPVLLFNSIYNLNYNVCYRYPRCQAEHCRRQPARLLGLYPPSRGTQRPPGAQGHALSLQGAWCR